MFITGYYDGAVIHVDEPLQVNQKVIVIPIENEKEAMENGNIYWRSWKQVIIKPGDR